MKSQASNWIIRAGAVCLPLAFVTGCDDDWGANEVISVIFAAGDVVLSILELVL